jgi:hypothetical protein
MEGPWVDRLCVDVDDYTSAYGTAKDAMSTWADRL